MLKAWILVALDELAGQPSATQHQSGQVSTYASHADWETQVCPYRLGLPQPERGRCKEKTVIDARVEKVLTGRYFRHLLREGRVIIPGRAT